MRVRVSGVGLTGEVGPGGPPEQGTSDTDGLQGVDVGWEKCRGVCPGFGLPVWVRGPSGRESPGDGVKSRSRCSSPLVLGEGEWVSRR